MFDELMKILKKRRKQVAALETTNNAVECNKMAGRIRVGGHVVFRPGRPPSSSSLLHFASRQDDPLRHPPILPSFRIMIL